MAGLAQVSHSGASTLQECERKYFFKYIVKIEKDVDFVTPDYFSFGQAFHKILEVTNHEHSNFSGSIAKGIIESHKLDFNSDGARIFAMLRKYWVLHRACGLRCKKCEIKFTGTYTNGFVDAVMVEPCGKKWWIVDIKTAGQVDNALPARIKLDQQLNLYAAFRASIAESCGLDPYEFAGIRYRESFKPLQVYKEGESFESFTSRCDAGAKCREIIIPASELDSKKAYAEFCQNISRAHELENEYKKTQGLVGRCNFKNCISYGRPCEYYSACYGKTYTESIGTANIISVKEEKGSIIVEGAKMPPMAEQAPAPVAAPASDEFGSSWGVPPFKDTSSEFDEFGSEDEFC